MDGTDELRSVIECHTGTLGSQMRMIIGAVEHVTDTFPAGYTTEKS
jgi:hypothetical protein